MWSTKEAMILAKSDKELLAALPKKPWYPICTDYGLRLLMQCSSCNKEQLFNSPMCSI